MPLLSVLLMKVFSTYVEVIPNPESLELIKKCILHVCGGDPKRRVFSTYVEVIPKDELNGFINYSILHVCGGDPHLFPKYRENMKYSPRMWR